MGTREDDRTQGPRDAEARQRPNDVEPVLASEMAAAGSRAEAALQRAWYLGGATILGLLGLEYGLFRTFALREIVWVYPFGFDQSVYLSRSYQAYEDLLARGLIPGLLESLRQPLPNSFLLHVQATFLFLFLGPSRLSALTLNFLYFALLQVCFAWTLHWLTRRWSAAFLGLGLLMVVQTPFLLLGGMTDFRADFGAFCLFGVFMSLVVRSGVFEDRRWSAVAGLAAASLVLYRFLTAVYLAGIIGLVLVWYVVRLKRSARGSAERLATERRIGGLLAAGVVFAVLVGPAFWYNRRIIWLYYILPESGPEKALRQALAGIHGLGDAVRFYPQALSAYHLTAAFWILAGVAIAFLWILRRLSIRSDPARRAPWPVDRTDAVVFAAVCLVVPLVVLTLVPIKWALLASICVPPILWLLMLPLAWLWPRNPGPGAARVLDAAPWALAATALAVGALTYVDGFGARTVFSRSRADVLPILQLYDLMGEHSAKIGWDRPRIFADNISDSIHYMIPFPLLYERHHVVVRAIPTVSGFWAMTEPDALAALERSDFVVLAVVKPPGPQFPFDDSMDALRTTLKAVCDRDFINLGTFRAQGRELVLYARPSLRLEGDSGGWITSNGLTLRGSSSVVRAFPTIELTGTSPVRFLPETLRVTAETTVANQAPRSVPARATISGPSYRIVLELDPRQIPEDVPLEIHVRFDYYFVPKQLGLNDDTRKLVLRTPDEVRLRPGS